MPRDLQCTGWDPCQVTSPQSSCLPDDVLCGVLVGPDVPDADRVVPRGGGQHLRVARPELHSLKQMQMQGYIYPAGQGHIFDELESGV